MKDIGYLRDRRTMACYLVKYSEELEEVKYYESNRNIGVHNLDSDTKEDFKRKVREERLEPMNKETRRRLSNIFNEEF
jgi:hypothetical protein